MSNSFPKYEVANSDNPEQLIIAGQKALVDAMLDAVKGIKSDESLGKTPGMTWDQIEFFLGEFKKRKPKIIYQDEPQ